MGEKLRDQHVSRLIVRGHFHDYHRETVRVANRYTADILLLPSLCGMAEYGRQATGSKPYVSNGMVMVEIIDGRLGRLIPMVKELDVRREERFD
jgi:hypothetical protein